MYLLVRDNVGLKGCWKTGFSTRLEYKKVIVYYNVDYVLNFDWQQINAYPSKLTMELELKNYNNKVIKLH